MVPFTFILIIKINNDDPRNRRESINDTSEDGEENPV